MQTEINRDLACRCIGDQHWHREGIDPRWVHLRLGGCAVHASFGAHRCQCPEPRPLGLDQRQQWLWRPSLQASRAANSASWAQRSVRRTSSGSRASVAASGTHPAIRTGRSSLQVAVSARMPERPANTSSQVELASHPSGETDPHPTIETRWDNCFRSATVRPFWSWKDRDPAIPDGFGCHPQF